MNAIGLEGVGTEEVPVDGWEFRSATLTVDSPVEMVIEASSFAGVQGTDGPITRELVYVGSSYSSDYEGLDVTDKIVLSNWDGYNLWIDAIGFMAAMRGAAGIVTSCMDSIYGQGPYALQCHDASWDTENWPPMIYIPKEYGFQLVEMLESGEEVVVTMESDIDLYFDAVGYNTIGYIPGKTTDELLIIGDHHDAWFTGAGDDTSGTAATLAIAKAIMDSGYQPERTLVFTTHTAEEYGTSNVYFDWCVGAWYQITREHPEWAGMAVAYLNFEMMGQKYGTFGIQTPIDLYPFMCEIAAENDYFMPYGVEVYTDISTWNDGWTFTAEGVPGITTAASGTGEYESTYIYHTQLDNLDSMDFEYLGQCIMMNAAIVMGLDQEAVIPYSFDARAQDFVQTWKRGMVLSTGVDPAIVEQISAEARKFAQLGRTWDMLRDSVAPSDVTEVNDLLLQTIVVVEDGFTAMEVWESTVYPHQQALLDCHWIQNAINELACGNAEGAMKNLKWWVGTVWYYDYVDYEYYMHDAIMLHADDNWGEQTQLGEIVDTWDVIASLEEKVSLGITDFSDEIDMLLDIKPVALGNLENGLDVVLSTLTGANALLELLVAMV